MNFERAFERVLGHEGGYVNDPLDPGGETNWGISKHAYPDVDIRALKREDAIKIYLRDFWWPVHAQDMPDLLALHALDFAVNSGPSTAIRYLQRALGVADDGFWGPVTQAAVKRALPAALLFRFLSERLDFMRRLSKWPRFGSGWVGRIASDMRAAADELEAAWQRRNGSGQ